MTTDEFVADLDADQELATDPANQQRAAYTGYDPVNNVDSDGHCPVDPVEGWACSETSLRDYASTAVGLPMGTTRLNLRFGFSYTLNDAGQVVTNVQTSVRLKGRRRRSLRSQLERSLAGWMATGALVMPPASSLEGARQNANYGESRIQMFSNAFMNTKTGDVHVPRKRGNKKLQSLYAQRGDWKVSMHDFSRAIQTVLTEPSVKTNFRKGRGGPSFISTGVVNGYYYRIRTAQDGSIMYANRRKRS